MASLCAPQLPPAPKPGVLPLRYDGLRKVKDGLTTLEEVFRVSDEGWVPILAKRE